MNYIFQYAGGEAIIFLLKILFAAGSSQIINFLSTRQ